MTFSLGLATFLTPKTQPNRAKTSFYIAKPCILHSFCVFLLDFRVFEGPGGARAALGEPQGVPGALRTLLGDPNGAFLEPRWSPARVLLERSWRLLRRSRGALALLAVSWRSLGAFWSPGTSFSNHFFPEKLFVLAFCATATETATASWSLALEALDQLGL